MAVGGTGAGGAVGNTLVAPIERVDVESLLAGETGSGGRADRAIEDGALGLALVDNGVVLLGG